MENLLINKEKREQSKLSQSTESKPNFYHKTIDDTEYILKFRLVDTFYKIMIFVLSVLAIIML